MTQETELKPTNLEVAIRLTSPTDEVREYQANTDQEGRYQVKAPIQLDEVGSYNSGVTYSDPSRLVFGMPQDNSTTNPNYAQAHYHLAHIYSLKNEKEQAIEWLQKAIVLEAGLMEDSKVDRGFDNIRQSPEFQKLINSQ